MTADGRYVAFSSDATNLTADPPTGTSDIYLRDLARGTTRRVNLPPRT